MEAEASDDFPNTEILSCCTGNVCRNSTMQVGERLCPVKQAESTQVSGCFIGDALRAQTPGEQVTVIFWDIPPDLPFLEAKVKEHWSVNVREVLYIPLCRTTEDEWKCAAKKATYIILYHSMESGKFIEDGPPYLEFCMETQDPSKIMVIVTDLEGSLCMEEMKGNWDQSSYTACSLQLITMEEMDTFRSSNKDSQQIN
ncbi:hypothetical protein XENTR_v10023438 [Xenopus tropicalis]|nr:hypothetical protein XENTR_v10023438 [Xenopus tropicalis]